MTRGRRWIQGVTVSAGLSCACPSSDTVPAAAIEERQEAAQAQTGPSAPSWGVAVMDRDAAIEAAELARDPAASALSEAAADPARRERAMWAWGRIGGALAVDRLLERVVATDPPPSSAELAAVAFLEPPAGLPGEAPEPAGAWAALEDALWTRYALTEKDDDAVALLLAAARIGGARSQQRLAADAAVVPEGDVAARYVGAMEAMGMLCARGYAIDRAGIDAVAHGLEASTPAREVAAYVVGRCAGPSAELLAGDDRAGIVERLQSVIVDADAETAALGWKALAALGEMPSAVPESILGQQPPPWQVEVEAIKALGGHAEGRRVLAERLGRFDPAWLEGTRGHPVIVALRGLRDGVVGNPEPVDALRAFAVAIGKRLDAAADRARKLPALVACELAVLNAIRSGDVAPVEACAVAGAGLPSTYGHVLAVDAIMKLADAEQRTTMLLTRADDPRAVVAEAALSALADVDDPRVNVVLRRGLERADAGVQAAAAGSIASRAADKSRRDEQAIPILGKAVRELDNGVAIEARVSAIEALGSLARSAEPPPLPKDATQSTTPLWLTGAIEPLARDGAFAVRQAARATLLHEPTALARFDAAVPESFPQGFDGRVADALARNRGATGLRIVTDAGTIEIDFTRAPAPIAQAVFADLAASGYFEGVLFHRVVPAFVVQGGDPRGDGYGGPGFVIPCERSSLRYERGTVGVALAGKDTGGSQFFIAHNREPRLDARYTIIGHVTEGMDVVDRILPYDVIERVEVMSR